MPDSWRLQIPAPTRWMNANQRDAHWSARSGRTKLWRDAAAVLAKQARIPRLQRVTITATVRRADRRRDCDAHNRYPTVKAAIDGVVDAGVLIDDCDRYLTALTIAAGEAVDKRRYPLGLLTLDISIDGGSDDEQVGGPGPAEEGSDEGPREGGGDDAPDPR